MAARDDQGGAEMTMLDNPCKSADLNEQCHKHGDNVAHNAVHWPDPEYGGSIHTCTKCCKNLEVSYEGARLYLTRKKSLLVKVCLAVFVLLWIIYLVYAAFKVGPQKALPVILISLFFAAVFCWHKVKKPCKGIIRPRLQPNTLCDERGKIWSKRCILCLLAIAFILFIALDTARQTESLISFGGLLLLIFIVFITSINPFKVKWRPVLWGFGIQFILAFIILRWDKGYQAFHFVGDQVKNFLEYSDAGAKFVFGNKNYLLHPIAFKVLPVVVFFSAVISVLYYWRIIQSIVETLAWMLQYTMGTTPVESLAAAAHIFVGQLESSVILKPFLKKLTNSELHAVMTTGFATIAGTVVAAYIEFGADPEHLLAASFMSGPAALALSKLGFPETEESVTKSEDDVKIPKGQQRNVIEAASEGASNAVKLIAYIVVNIIAFLSILEFINAILSYLGSTVGIDNLTFQLICSYVFMPLAAVMGIPWEDTGHIGSLIGTKIFINEFVGYAELGPMIKNGLIQNRSGVMATYILCGFGSIQSLGITIAVFSAVAPSRRRDVAGHMVRALILGNIACFTTACIAGMLYIEQSEVSGPGSNVTTIFISTLP